MTKKIKLSKRLQTVAAYLPQGANFADIGSDHAYLPCYVCSLDKEAKAIAGEVNEGPYKSAVETVNLFQLQDVIDVRLGDGLAVINDGEISELVIAGMGGALIKAILEGGNNKISGVQRIIAQPNVDEKNVRQWFVDNDFIISEESILEENGHIYEIIVGDRLKDTQINELDGKQILFGPKLLQHKSEIFYKKWETEKLKRLRVMNQINQATIKDIEKMKQFEKEIKWIEEVLLDAETFN